MGRLNLFDPNVRRDPYPCYAELRRSPPVEVDPGGFWAVSRHDDVVGVFKDTMQFSSDGLRSMAIQPWIERNPMSESFILMDPPHHTKFRALVAHAFGARVIPRIDPVARSIATAFAVRARDGGEIDVCAELSSTLPAAVTTSLLGFDSALSPRIHVWAADFVSINAYTPFEARAHIIDSVAQLERYVKEALADRRRERRDDLVSDLIDAEIDGQRLTDDELVSVFFLLLVAGYESTTHLLTNALRVLAEHPGLVSRLRAEPASIPNFIEEVLRFDPPVHGTLRLALSDVTVGGARIPANSIVLLLPGSANRDERHFDDPDRFNMDRRERASIHFGHGIHFCLGAALSRTEARIALEEILPHIRGVRVTREPEWNLSINVRGALSCWMEFLPA